MKGKFKLSSFFLGLALIFSVFMPAINVFAERPSSIPAEYNEVEIFKEGGSDCDIVSVSEANGADSITINFEHGNVITISRFDSTPLYSYTDTSGEHPRYFIYGGTGDVDIRATATEGYDPFFWINGSGQDVNHCRTSLSISNIIGSFVLQNNSNPGGNEDPQQGFDGNVYFAWLDGNNNVCYHKFSNFTGRKEDGSYDINYVGANDLTDESGNGVNYTFGQEPANWVLASDMEEGGAVKENLTKEYVFGNGQYDMGVQLDPCGAKNGAHSICTNGDRNFRATIYEEGYQAIKFDTSEDSVDFFPNFWDQTFYSSTVDVSGTTPENPAVFETYLLNGGIFFSAGEHSSAITSVKALGVDEGALNIDNQDEQWAIWFMSNYYDHVVFEVTAEGGAKYYIRIARVTFNISDNFAPGQENKKVIASFYYPNGAGWSMSYESFDVIATKVKKDGSRETSIVQAIDMIDPLTGEMVTRDSDGGKNLRMSFYSVDIDDGVAGVYFTVVNKGALDGGKEFYDGTFSGSGKGIFYNLSDRQMKYDV